MNNEHNAYRFIKRSIPSILTVQFSLPIAHDIMLCEGFFPLSPSGHLRLFYYFMRSDIVCVLRTRFNCLFHSFLFSTNQTGDFIFYETHIRNISNWKDVLYALLVYLKYKVACDSVVRFTFALCLTHNTLRSVLKMTFISSWLSAKPPFLSFLCS